MVKRKRHLTAVMAHNLRCECVACGWPRAVIQLLFRRGRYVGAVSDCVACLSTYEIRGTA